MNKRQVLRIDFFVQVGMILFMLGTGTWSYFYGQSISWVLLLFFLFIIWQFFSAIYMAAEFKMWHRSIPPIALVLLIVLGIALGQGIVALLFMPFMLLANLLLAGMDWYRAVQQYRMRLWQNDSDTILDTEEIFK
ncbi:MAG: hypothetical protein ACK4TA_14095 [Saprospiraceae bacterium]